jgi:hypothetical protein
VIESCNEKYGTRKTSGTSAETHWVITGYDYSARQTLLATAPTSWTVNEPFGDLTFIREDENCAVEEVADGIFWGTVQYKSPADAILPAGQFTVSFDISGMQTKITQSYSTVSSYMSPSATAAGVTKPNFHGAINVSADGTIEGTDIQIPTLCYTIKNTYTDDEITASGFVATTIMNCVGSPNSATYRGFAAGQLLLTSASGVQRSDTNWDVTYKFQVGKPAVSVTIGDITGINADGWDYVWVYYEDLFDSSTNRVNKKPVSVYVERILQRADYAGLNIGAGS